MPAVSLTHSSFPLQLYKACLGGHKTSRSLQLPARIFKVSLEASIELSHKISPGGLSNTLLSEECVLEKVPVVRSVGRTQTSKDRGKGGDPPVAQVLVVGPAAMSSQ